MPEETKLSELLDRYSAPAATALAAREDERIRCLACGHRCVLGEGRRGSCRVRFVRDGVLRVPFGYTAGIAVDPIEKKPFFHVLPGKNALSFGMLGCDLHCSYCQNWQTSQTLRDRSALAMPRPIDASELVALARREDAPVLVSTYNEPLITAEWSRAIFEKAKEAGLLCGYVSNGNATPELLDWLRPYCDLYKVDLKSFRDAAYRSLGAPLSQILDGITAVHERGYWIEVVTLVVPGFNDSSEELRGIADFIAGLSPEIPWHVTAFHPQYRMRDPSATPIETLRKAHAIGRDAGLDFVYIGNLPGEEAAAECTWCPSCREPLVERIGYRTRVLAIEDACCAHCGVEIPGLWETPS